MQSSNVSNKSMCALRRSWKFSSKLQIKFRAAKLGRASSFMWVSQSRWWAANW